jgi:probable rRNA maturation factor
VPVSGTADNPQELGDVALSYDTCLAEAAAQGKPVDHHVTHLIIHGVLHLLGYDHQTDADAALMEGIEMRALADLGISNPY